MALVIDSAPPTTSAAPGLERFLAFVRCSGSTTTFTKALAGEYPSARLAVGLSPATLNLRLAPVRRLAREMAENGLLDPAVAAAIERVPGVTRHGTRVGNWLTKEQAQRSAQRARASTRYAASFAPV